MVPALLMVAIEVALLLQLPPVARSVSVAAAPAHNVAVPVIAPASGIGLTVTILILTVAPQLEEIE